MNRDISVSEIIADAWAIAKRNVWILIGITAVQFVFMFIATMILAAAFGGESPAGALMQNVIINLIDAFFAVAIYQVFFKLIDDETNPEFPDFVPNIMRALNFILVKLIMGLAAVFLIAMVAAVYFFNKPDIEVVDPLSWEILPVFILIAIPLIYFTTRLCFVLCFIVDQDSGASESISQSWTLSKGHFWFLFLLFLIMLAINILGTMFFFIGLLFSYPLSILILIVTYRKMVNDYTDEEAGLIDTAAADGN